MPLKMKLFQTLIFLFVVYTLQAQSRNAIVGEWYIKEFEDIENGQTYRLKIDYDATIMFSPYGKFYGTRLCNGFGGSYKTDGGILILQENGKFHSQHCPGAKSAIEKALHTYNEEFELKYEGGDISILSPSKFKLILSKFP
jgi:hypothetical protein